MATQVRLPRASGDAPPANGELPLPFACECRTSGCDATVELPLEVHGPERRVLAH